MSTDPALRWCHVSNPPGDRIPRWCRSAALAADGTIYAPAAMTDNEQAAIHAAAWDGDVPMVIDDGHAYLPTRWLAREFPHIADICDRIEARVRAFFPEETP